MTLEECYESSGSSMNDRNLSPPVQSHASAIATAPRLATPPAVDRKSLTNQNQVP